MTRKIHKLDKSGDTFADLDTEREQALKLWETALSEGYMAYATIDGENGLVTEREPDIVEALFATADKVVLRPPMAGG